MKKEAKTEKIDFIIKKANELEITAYQIAKKTNLSTFGIQKIIDGSTKKPYSTSLNLIYNAIIEIEKEDKISNYSNENSVNEKPTIYSHNNNKVLNQKIYEITLHEEILKLLPKNHPDIEHHQKAIKLLNQIIEIIKSNS